VAVLSGLRKSLRQRLRKSPLMDERSFVRDLESAYRHMWRAWCGSR
jgi:protein O-GlcNAc transferase